MNMRLIGFVMVFGLSLTSWLAGPAVSVTQAAALEAELAAKSAEHGGHGEGGGDPNPLAFDPDLAIFTGLVFLLLFGILSVFAWPQISTALFEREQSITKNIADALAKHEDAKKLLLEHEAKLANAANEVRALLEEARRDAEQTKVQIVAEAKKAANEERDRALRDVERAADQAMKNLAETGANLAVDLAGKIVKQNISADQQAQLVRDALGKMDSMSPSKN